MPRGGKRPGAGRPKGGPLPSGAVKAIQACVRSQSDDPLAQEAEGVILQVMRKPARYAGTRLSAASMLLDHRRGKPIQQVQHSGTITHEIGSKLDAALKRADGQT